MLHSRTRRRQTHEFAPGRPRPVVYFLLWLAPLAIAGCYAPLVSPGVPARCLPESFRTPVRAIGVPLNFATLTIPVPEEYILGRDDVLEVTIHNLFPAPQGQGSHTLQTRVMGNGEIMLPVVGPVRLGGMNLLQAHRAITKSFADGFIRDVRVSVFLLEKSTTDVLVLGEVARPAVYRLPKYENDVAHALAEAGGLSPDSGTEIQVHRRVSAPPSPPARCDSHPWLAGGELVRVPPVDAVFSPRAGRPSIFSIPVRGNPPIDLTPEDVILNNGDVVFVPSRTNEVFFVVGKLSSTNFVRFSLGRENRDLGTGFVLPRDRDVTVVTAVAMAGYIDPIDSPTTVTVQRTFPDCQPMLIHVDLIAARFDRNEDIMVQAGDIIYLNPDGPWWFRRMLDRILPDLIVFPYERAILKAFGQQRQ